MKGHIKRKTFKRVFWGLVLIGIAILIISHKNAPESTTEPINGEYEEIRNSPEMKRQFELMVQEKGLLKDKAELEADYKAKMDAIEAKLEAVRAEKLSFK